MNTAFQLAFVTMFWLADALVFAVILWLATAIADWVREQLR